MLTSRGLKRRIVSLLAFVADILRSIPGTELYLVYIDQVIGLLGGTAVVHAGAAKTLPQEKLSTAVAVVYALIALAQWVPALQPLLPVLYKLAGILSTARVAIGTKESLAP